MRSARSPCRAGGPAPPSRPSAPPSPETASPARRGSTKRPAPTMPPPGRGPAPSSDGTPESPVPAALPASRGNTPPLPPRSATTAGPAPAPPPPTGPPLQARGSAQPPPPPGGTRSPGLSRTGLASYRSCGRCAGTLPYSKIDDTTSSMLRCTSSSSVNAQTTATWQARRACIPSVMSCPA